MIPNLNIKIPDVGIRIWDSVVKVADLGVRIWGSDVTIIVFDIIFVECWSSGNAPISDMRADTHVTGGTQHDSRRPLMSSHDDTTLIFKGGWERLKIGRR